MRHHRTEPGPAPAIGRNAPSGARAQGRRGPLGLVIAADVRRRWRSLLGVAFVLAAGGAVVMTAVSGARRTDSAFPRLRQSVLASDASVEVEPRYFERIAALPEVDAVAPLSFMFVSPVGMSDDDLLSTAGVDDRFGTVVDRPQMVSGRRPRSGRADEVLVNTVVADRLHLRAGSRLTLSSLTPGQMDAMYSGADPGPPAGPKIGVTVVGVGRSEMEAGDQTPLLVMTPAFYFRHRGAVAHYDDVLEVRLHRGDADVAAFERGVRRVVPASVGAVVEDQSERTADAREATRVQAVSLLALAGAVAVAVAVATGGALARQADAAAAGHRSLEALGMSRRQRFLVVLVPLAAVVAVAAAAAVGLAVLASPAVPIGFARRVDPDPGLFIDGPVLAGGVAALIVLMVARAALASWRAVARPGPGAVPGRPARSVTRLASLGAPPPVHHGVRFAVDGGPKDRDVPVRPALLGAIAGVAGLVAALTFGAGLRWAAREPAAYGVAWDVALAGPRGADLDATDVQSLAGDAEVGQVAGLRAALVRLDGQLTQGYGVDAVKGGGFVSVLDGRAPQGRTEVLVGSATLERLHARIGDTVRAARLSGRQPVELTIVGRGVFPEFVPIAPESDVGAYNDFALLTGPGGGTLLSEGAAENVTIALVRWSTEDGASAATSSRRERLGSAVPVVRPHIFANLDRVVTFPWVVAGFLVLVAALATAHVLAVSVRRRAKELAVFRTLGFTGRQVRATIAWQAATLAAVGLLVGVPVGLAVGRSAWAVMADRLGIERHLPLPWAALALTVPAVIAVALLLAVPPGRRAAGTRAALALRSE